MSDKFGFKIGIEGEREFKQALTEINSAFKVLGSEMRLASSEFDKNDRSVQALAARNAVLGKEIDAQKGKIETLKSALDNAAASFGEGDRRTQEWQRQLNNAQAALNGMERELEKNEGAMKSHSERYDDLGRVIDETAREYAKAREEYGKNSAEAKELEARLRELGAEHREAGKAADAEDKAVADVTKSLGLYSRDAGAAAKETSAFGDTLKAVLTADAIKAGFKALADMAKAVGEAVKGFVSEGMGMATAAAESQTLLTQVMRNTMDASDGEVQSLLRLASAQEKVGVVSKTAQTTALAELASFVGRKEALEDMLPVMNDYIAYQYGATASSEQARNVATALGKAINGSIDGLAKQGFTLTDTEKKWFKTATEAERVAFVMDMVGESMGGVNEALAQTDAGKMAALNNVVDNTKTAVGQLANETKAQILGEMLPSISSLSEAFLGVLHGDGSVEQLAGAFTGVFQQVSDSIGESLPQLADMAGQLISALAAGLADNVGILVDAGLGIVNALVAAILPLIPVIVDAGMKLLMGLLQGLVQNLPAIAGAAAQMVSSLAKALSSALPQLVPAAMEAVRTVIKTLISMLPELVAAGGEIMAGLARGLGDAVPLVKPVTAAIAGIAGALDAMVPYILAATAGFAAFKAVLGIQALLAGISAAIAGVSAAIAGETLATNASTVSKTANAIATNVINAAKAVAVPLYALFTGATIAETAAQWGLNAAMLANPIGLIIAGVVALIAVVAVLVGWFNRTTDEQKALNESTEKLAEENDRLVESMGASRQAYADRQSDMAAEAGAATRLASEMERLSKIENKSAEDKTKLAATCDALNKAMGGTVVTYDAESDSLSRNVDEIYARIGAMKAEAEAQAARERMVEIAKEQMLVEEGLAKIGRQREELNQALIDGVYKKGEEDKKYTKLVGELNESEAALLAQQGELEASFGFVSQAAADAASAHEEANAKIVESIDEASAKQKEANDLQEELTRQKAEREREATQAMVEAANEQGMALDDYKVQLKQTQKAQEEYAKSVEKTTDSVVNSFDKAKTDTGKSLKQMISNTKENAKSYSEYTALMAELSGSMSAETREAFEKMGVSGLKSLRELKKGGTEAMGQMNSVMAEASAAGVAEVNRQYGGIDMATPASGAVSAAGQAVSQNKAVETAAAKQVQGAKAAAMEAVASGGFDAVGKAIVDGVSSGIQAREAAFRAQVNAFFKRVVTSAKAVLVIESPSKVFENEIGAQIPAGLASGIAKGTPKAAAAAEKMARDTFSKAKTWIEGYRLESGYLASEELAMWESLSKKYAANTKQRVDADREAAKVREQIAKDAERAAKEAEKAEQERYASEKKAIESYRQESEYSAAKELEMWEALSAKYAGNADRRLEIDKKMASLRAQIYKEIYAGEKQAIEEYRLESEHSAARELEMWAALSIKYADDRARRLEIDKKMASLKAQIDQDSFNEAKKQIDERKQYGDMALGEEVAAWERVQRRYLKGSKEREAADKQLFEAKKRLLAEQERLQKKIEDAEAGYAKAVEGRAQAIFSAFGLFGEVRRKDVSRDALMWNLEDQVDEMRSWADNMGELARRGIGEGLIAELEKMGPAANSEISALVDMTDEELKRYSSLWQEKQELARKQAVRELRGLREETNAEVRALASEMAALFAGSGSAAGENLVQNALDALGRESHALLAKARGLGAEMVDSIAEGAGENGSLGAAAEELVQIARGAAASAIEAAKFADLGKNMVESVFLGIVSRETWFRAQITAFFQGIVSAAKKSLGIQSPSKVFAGIGESMAQGIGAGFGAAMGRVARDMQAAVPRSFDAGAEARAGAHGGPGQAPGGQVVNQAISITAPRALSERELAREFRNMSRKLAMEVG